MLQGSNKKYIICNEKSSLNTYFNSMKYLRKDLYNVLLSVLSCEDFTYDMVKVCCPIVCFPDEILSSVIDLCYHELDLICPKLSISSVSPSSLLSALMCYIRIDAAIPMSSVIFWMPVRFPSRLCSFVETLHSLTLLQKVSRETCFCPRVYWKCTVNIIFHLIWLVSIHPSYWDYFYQASWLWPFTITA